MIDGARNAVVFAALMAFWASGVLMAGVVANFFYFVDLTGSKTLAACYLAAEFLVLALLTLIGYKLTKK